MEETLLLAAFGASPLILGILCFLFFRKLKTWEAKWPPWLVLLGGNLVVSLLLGSCLIAAGETYYRFFFDETDSFALSKTTGRWMDRHFELNAMGFRDSVVLYPMRPPQGTRRVTFLGDSFTAGHGVANVEDRFANRIRAQKPDVEVHVLARTGLDTAAEHQLISDMGQLGYVFDSVVLVYCLNDISDITPAWRRVSQRFFGSGGHGWLVDHSFLFNRFYFRWRAARDPDIKDYYSLVRDAYEGRIWEQQIQRLRALHEEVQSYGGRLRVVTFPFLHALGADYEYRGVHDQLDALWNELGVPHLDLLTLYGSREPQELVVNAYDAHPNEHAHALAADRIARFLDESP